MMNSDDPVFRPFTEAEAKSAKINIFLFFGIKTEIRRYRETVDSEYRYICDWTDENFCVISIYNIETLTRHLGIFAREKGISMEIVAECAIKTVTMARENQN